MTDFRHTANLLLGNGGVAPNAIVCRTNLDSKFGWEFPKVFVAIPEVGDYVIANERPLQVCARYFDNGIVILELTGQPSHS